MISEHGKLHRPDPTIDFPTLRHFCNGWRRTAFQRFRTNFTAAPPQFSWTVVTLHSIPTSSINTAWSPGRHKPGFHLFLRAATEWLSIQDKGNGSAI